MAIKIEKSVIEGVYWVHTTEDDTDRMYGAFSTYKEASDFIENTLGVLYEHGVEEKTPCDI
jgi:hypothetical protein